jgi:hypothetical protein
MACHPSVVRWITKVTQTLKSYHKEFHHIISAALITRTPRGYISLGVLFNTNLNNNSYEKLIESSPNGYIPERNNFSFRSMSSKAV